MSFNSIEYLLHAPLELFVSIYIRILADVILSDMSFSTKIGPALDENDQYSLLRKAAKQHWSTMKEYYVAVSLRKLGFILSKHIALLEQACFSFEDY